MITIRVNGTVYICSNVARQEPFYTQTIVQDTFLSNRRVFALPTAIENARGRFHDDHATDHTYEIHATVLTRKSITI